MLAEPLAPQRPRLLWIPPAFAPCAAGEEAVELAAIAGLNLDPWQQLVLEGALGGVRENGKWAAFEVGLVVSRQNGKGSILEARELAGLFVLGERLIVHTAHQFDTSLEAFMRLLQLIEQTPELDRRVLSVSKSHGTEGLTVRVNGKVCRIRFRTRTAGGGRGFTGDCLIFDEAMILRQASHGTLIPTLAARPNAQIWYAGSAVDQTIHDEGLVLAHIRERARTETDRSLAYFEFSLEVDLGEDDREPTPDDVTPELAGDRDGWAQANPSLGIRISADYVELEQVALSPRAFAVERLGVGDWPTLSAGQGPISLDDWRALIDELSRLSGAPCFAFDVTPDRSSSSIAAAGPRLDDQYGHGLRHVEVVEHRAGTGWLVARMVALARTHNPVGILYDGAGPAASLAAELEELGLTLTPVSAQEHAQACGLFYDEVKQAQLRHLGTAEMTIAIRGSRTRPLGDAWAWSRKTSATDISPLVACTLANWGSLILTVAEPFTLAF